jgi:hypothetical protein
MLILLINFSRAHLNPWPKDTIPKPAPTHGHSKISLLKHLKHCIGNTIDFQKTQKISFFLVKPNLLLQKTYPRRNYLGSQRT